MLICFLFPEQAFDEFDQFVQKDDTESERDDFEPHERIQRHGVEEQPAELRDDDLQGERDGKTQQHQSVFEEIFEDALFAEFAAVEGVKQLEQHEQRKDDGGHHRLVPFGHAEEVEKVLHKAYHGNVNAVEHDAPQHFRGHDALAAPWACFS